MHTSPLGELIWVDGTPKSLTGSHIVQACEAINNTQGGASLRDTVSYHPVQGYFGEVGPVAEYELDHGSPNDSNDLQHKTERFTDSKGFIIDFRKNRDF